MRLLFVADGRSPIALNWMEYLIQAGHEVHLVSTFPCNPSLNFASLDVVPVAFSRMKRAPLVVSTGELNGPAAGNQAGLIRRLLSVGMRTGLRQFLGPATLPGAARRLAQIIDRLQPDLVHAMRIPYEGMLAALSKPSQPLLISIWGNDFTLHAKSNPWMAYLTRLAISRATALHADCQRDLHLAENWGFPPNRAKVVLPGGGGIQTDLFYPPVEPASLPIAINPRGFRAYVRNDVFFHAIPLVLKVVPQARFLCTGMEREPQARRWVDELKLGEAVSLLPPQTRPQMADLFRQSQVLVSPSNHDGTPNTFLEALACGCFPVVGDLDSLREWIQPEVNGLLVNPSDSHSLAAAIVQAFSDEELRKRAAEKNIPLIREKAEYQSVMRRAEAFYQSLI
jgi:glycosyltransferase involved in cell wall biosynthesis